MQMLYSASRNSASTFDELLQQYNDNIYNSYKLYLFNLLYLTKIAEYAVQDGKLRQAKHLPTEADKKFSDKLFTNEVLQSLLRKSTINDYWKKFGFHEWIDEDIVRQLYKAFAKTDEYQNYLLNISTTHQDHKQVLLALFKFCISTEIYDETIYDRYWSWDDDRSLVVGAVKKTLKALPENPFFYEQNLPDKEATKDFGEKLLEYVYKRGDELRAIIEPALQNWDADRVAVMDMIVLKMAVCELTIFPSIPTKVTLNEFVEIAKSYSTDKSKEFINGILDRLMKQLHKEGKISKEGRGLIG